MAFDGPEIRLLLAALAALPAGWLLLGAPRGRFARFALPAAALAAALLYFVGSRPPAWINRHDLFHSAVTARWYGQVGYTDLYDCVLAADRDRLAGVAWVRELDTLDLVPAAGRDACAMDGAARAGLRADLDFWHQLAPAPGWWQRLLVDKGYNGTPVHLALARALFGGGELSLARLRLAAAIDVLLILGAFALLWRARGGELAALAFLWFCTSFANHFSHMGGSFLRYGWFAATVAGLLLLPRRPALAGAALGLAAAERVFPALLAAGVVVRAGWRLWRTRRLEARYPQFALGFVAAAGAAMIAGALYSGATWSELAADLSGHVDRGGTFRIGLPALLPATAAWLIGCAVLLAAALALVDDLDDAGFAALFGVVALFALVAATRYYHAAFALLFLVGHDHRRERWWARALGLLFCASLVVTAVWLAVGSPSLTYNLAASLASAAVLAWILGASLARRRRASVDRP